MASNLFRSALISVAVLATAFPAPAQEPRVSSDAIGRSVLRCYRPTATFDHAVAITETDVLAKGRHGLVRAPGDRRALVERFGEASIAYIRIYWRGGVSGASHVSDVAILMRTRNGHAESRTELLADTGIVPVVPRFCRSAVDWVGLEPR